MMISNVKFNRMPRPSDKVYNDEVFADRFRYQLIMFEIRLLVRLSRLLHADIACEVAVAKSPPKYVEFSIVLHDLKRLYSIFCRVQATRYTMIIFSLIRYKLTMFEMPIAIRLSRLIHDHIVH